MLSALLLTALPFAPAACLQDLGLLQAVEKPTLISRSLAQEEETAPVGAVDPADPEHMVIFGRAHRDSGPWRDLAVYYVTFDGGKNWARGELSQDPLLPFALPRDVAFDPAGNVHALVSATDWNTEFDSYHTRSQNGGLNWGVRTWFPVSTAAELAVDDSGGARNGAVYAWLNEMGYASGPAQELHRSDDAGQSFQAPAPPGTLPQDNWNADPVQRIGLQGELIHLYLQRDHPPPLEIRMNASLDGGATWPVNNRLVLQQMLSAHHAPQLAAALDRSGGPFHGRLHLAWNAGTTSETDIWASWSDDQGATWAPPVLVHAGPAGTDQIYPDLEVDDHGRVGLIYFSDELDPSGEWDLLFQASGNGGAAWCEPLRITPRSFPNYPGYETDYTDLLVSPKGFLPLWSDTRGGTWEIWLSRVNLDALPAGAGLAGRRIFTFP